VYAIQCCSIADPGGRTAVRLRLRCAERESPTDPGGQTMSRPSASAALRTLWSNVARVDLVCLAVARQYASGRLMG
jgi:hypothetical protein